MTYDEEDRHVSTSVADGTRLSYERDATGAIVEMTTATSTGATKTERYSSGGDLQWQLNPGGWIDGGTVNLTGGVTVSTNEFGSYVGSFSDLQGATTVVTDSNGNRQGSVYLYDPFGQALDPASGAIGSTSSDSEQPGNTTVNGISAGWAGSAGKMTADFLPVQTIEMGDRQYVPGLGRFLSVDPVPGGNENDYTYAVDPINSSDYSGDFVTGYDGNPNAIPYNKTAAASNKAMRAVFASTVRFHSVEAIAAKHSTWAAPRATSRSLGGVNVQWSSKSNAEANEHALETVANISNTVSTITGFAALIPGPWSVPLLALSMATGVLGAAIDCRHGLSAGCDTDVASLGLGELGDGMRLLKAVGVGRGVAETTGKALDGAGATGGLMGATFGAAYGWGTYANG